MKVISVLVLCVTLLCQGHSNALDSCQGRCGYGTDSNFSCQCNPACETYKDCCSDYIEVCKAGASCKGRCDEIYNSQNECHCNSKCTQYNNCCSDYTDLCNNTWPLSHGQHSFVIDKQCYPTLSRICVCGECRTKCRTTGGKMRTMKI